MLSSKTKTNYYKRKSKINTRIEKKQVLSSRTKTKYYKRKSKINTRIGKRQCYHQRQSITKGKGK